MEWVPWKHCKVQGDRKEEKGDLIHEEKEEARVHPIHPNSVEGRSNQSPAGLFLGTEIYLLHFHTITALSGRYATHVS